MGITLNKVFKHFLFMIVALMIIGGSFALSGTISKNYSFTAGTVISSSQINSNFDQIITELNAKETRMTTLESGAWSVLCSRLDTIYK